MSIARVWRARTQSDRLSEAVTFGTSTPIPGGHFGHQHANTRTIDMPSAMADECLYIGCMWRGHWQSSGNKSGHVRGHVLVRPYEPTRARAATVVVQCATERAGLYSYGLHSDGLYSYGVCSYGPYICVLYS